MKNFSKVIFTLYLEKLIKLMKSPKQFIEAAGFLYLQPYQWDSFDLDQDQEEEIVFLQEDILGREYILLNIINKNEQNFNLIQEKIQESYFNSHNSILYPSRPLKLLDLTGDSVPEILLFLNSGRYGAHLHVFEYKNRNLQRVLYIDEFKYPKYIFTDTNKNLIPEIIIKDVGVKYEYNKKTNSFIKIKEVETAYK
ncbi:hypothetical protein KKF94_00425 [Patescibacteria group bacterium]|nr:hypothetical protein [Patescibacteria group bacterium]